jgi:hypothetical protein
MTPEQQQAMMKAMTPGEHHKHIAQFAGKFEYTSKMWMTPGTEPIPYKQVVTLIDEKHHKMEWYTPSEQGEMFKSMELYYTRVK